jgi:HAD superfamily hydrolase (TIGR01509 family)
MIRALLWDVDGTLAETERYGHLPAFNRAFAAAGVPWRWSEERYGELLNVAGGRERLLHDMRTQPAAPATDAQRRALAKRLHQLKNQHYALIVASGALPLRPGVVQLLEECSEAGVRLGIVTTSSRANVAALLSRHLGAAWGARFATVVCAEEAPRKKPDPQAYRRALQTLRLRAEETVAIEDSPAGIEAARRAGVPVLVARSYYFNVSVEVCAAAAALASGPSLGVSAGWQPPPSPPEARITLNQIERWYAGSVARHAHAGSAPKVS